MVEKSAFSRRELLKRLGLAGAAAAAMPELSRVLLFRQSLGPLDPAVAYADAQTPPPRESPETLSATEAATLAAVCARIIPTDVNGPGATEARASHYIDRALGGALAASRDAYAIGLAAIDEGARAQKGRAFIQLSAAEQDAVLAEQEQTPFFGLVRGHTLQGTFCDPAYGGNANFVGWDLLGYPGVRLSVSAADQRMASPPKPNHRSAYDYAMFSVTHPAKTGAADAH
jgi:gluconate 2-dehydrogenase gamma chain